MYVCRRKEELKWLKTSEEAGDVGEAPLPLFPILLGSFAYGYSCARACKSCTMHLRAGVHGFGQHVPAADRCGRASPPRLRLLLYCAL